MFIAEEGSVRTFKTPKRLKILCSQRSVTGLFKNTVILRSAEHCWYTWGRMVNTEFMHLFYDCKVRSDVTSLIFFFF